jgi:hypothetical protein
LRAVEGASPYSWSQFHFALNIVGFADTIDYELRITHYELIYCALRITHLKEAH